MTKTIPSELGVHPERGMDGTLRAFNVSQPWDNELPGIQGSESGKKDGV